MSVPTAGSNSLGEAIFRIGVDQSDLNTGVDQAEGKLQALAKRAADAVGGLDAFAQSAMGLDKLGSAADGAGVGVGHLGQSFDDLAQSVLKQNGATDDASQSFDDLASSIAKQNGQADDAASSLRDMGQATDKAGDSAGKAGGSVKSFGQQAAAATEQIGKFGLALFGIQQAASLLQHISDPLKEFISGSVDAASDLNESVNKVNVVFKDSAGVILDWAKGAAQDMGLADQAALDLGSNFGALFEGIGQSTGDAAKLTQELIGRAADLASIYNLDLNDAIEKIRSGLVGEAEPLRSLNVFLTQAAVEAKATALGFQKVGGQFSQQALIMARYALIMEQTAVAQGDFQNTSSGLANSQRILSAEVENLKADMGADLLPVMQAAVRIAGSLVEGFSDLPGPMKTVVLVLGGMATALSVIVPLAGAATAAFAALNVSLGVIGLIALAISALVAGVVLLISNWDTITEHAPIVGKAVGALADGFGDLKDIIVGSARVGAAAVKGFATTIVGVFDLVKNVLGGVSQLFDDIQSLHFNRVAGDVKAIGQAATDAVDKIRQGFGEIGDSVDEFHKQADDATESVQQIGGAAEQMQDGIHNGIQSVQNMTSALGDWTEAQRAIDGAIDQSGAAVDLWTKKQAAAQKALDDLDAIKKKDGGLNADQQAQYDTLTHYVARLGAGITDDLQPAYIDAQVQAAKFQETQDKLNQQLASGQITQDQYNDAVAAAKDAAQGALDPTTKLADANANLGKIVDKLNDTLHATLVALGLIPPDTPVEVSDDGTIDRTKGKFLEMNDVIVKTPEETVTKARADTVEANRKFKDLEQNVTNFPKQFTITPDVNTGPFEEAITKIDRMIPHSPAKEGPLSKEPNWDFLFQGIDAAAGNYTDDALDHLKNFVQTAQSIWDALKEQVSFAQDVSDFTAAGGTLPSDDFITQLKFAAEHTIQSMGDTAALYSGDFVDAAGKLGSAVQSAFGGLSAEVSFAKDLKDAGDAVNDFIDQSSQIETDLKFAAEHAVQSFGDSAAVLGSDGLDNASAFGDAVQKVFGGLGAALSFAKEATGALSDSVNLTDDRLDGVLDSLSDLAKRAGQRFAAIGADAGDDLDAAKAAGDALGAPFAALSAAVDFVKDLSDAAQEKVQLVVPENILKSLTDLIRRTNQAFAAANQSLTGDVLDNARDLSENLAAPFDLYSKALDFLSDVTDFAKGGVQANIGDRFVANLTDTITKITTAFRNAAQALGTDGLDDAQALAATLTPILDTIQPLKDGIMAVFSMPKLGDHSLDTLRGNIDTVLKLVSDLRDRAEATLPAALAFKSTMETIQAAMQAAEGIADSIGNLAKSNVNLQLTAANIAVLPTSLTNAASAMSAPAGNAGGGDAEPVTVNLDFDPTFNISLGNEQFRDYIITIVNQVLTQQAGRTF